MGFGNPISGGDLTLSGTAKITNVSPSSGPVGTEVTVNAAGFVPNEEVGPSFGTIQLPAATANALGEVNFTFKAGTQSGGDTTISLYGKTTNITQTAIGIFKITGQLISVYPISGKKNDSITVSGNGYIRSTQVYLDFGQVTSLASKSVANDGTFAMVFNVPSHPRGLAEMRIRSSNAQKK